MCKRPCKECPYTKKSIPGYFGGHDPAEYSDAISTDTIVACHTKSSFDDDGFVRDVVPCVGHVVSQIVSCKSPLPTAVQLSKLHKDVRALEHFDELKSNSLSVFNFNQHHMVV